jgi:hypothetical protein
MSRQDFSHRWRVSKRMVTQRCEKRASIDLDERAPQKAEPEHVMAARILEHLPR